jgi:hypothetical protein
MHNSARGNDGIRLNGEANIAQRGAGFRLKGVDNPAQGNALGIPW